MLLLLDTNDCTVCIGVCGGICLDDGEPASTARYMAENPLPFT